MGLKQSMKQSLGMTMTPQLQQAIKILQMSMMELQQEVTNAIVENPALEESYDDDDQEQDQNRERRELQQDSAEKKDPVEEMKDDFDWQSYIDSGAQQFLPSNRNQNPDDFPTFDQVLSRPQSLYDHLARQLRLFAKNERDLEVGEEILGNINDDGYLVIITEELMERLKGTREEIASMIQQVQYFDPPGVAARDLKECLLIQCEVRHLGSNVRKIIEAHLPELENKNYVAISKGLDLALKDVIEASRAIHALEPKPGRAFSNTEPYYITPDIYVVEREGKYEVVLNEQDLPRVRLSKLYKAMINDKEFKGDAKKYIKEKMKDAVWLLKSIDQRQKTIFRVTEAIVERQMKFFQEGKGELKPMILRDISEELGLHESTVSRVTTNKFVHTPHGIFELKYFFSSAISRTDGDDMASESVKQKIKFLVDAEDAKKPLSDQQIVKGLAEDNIKIARRTVAKYREAMGILPSNKRKKYF